MGKKFEHSHLINEAKTGPGKRAVASRLSKIIESPKNLLLLKGHSTSSIGAALLSDICMLKKPYCKKLQRKNEVLPFEAGGEAHLENLCRLNDCSQFMLVNHSKKRPHNLILGRTFGFRILEMFEFALSNFQPMAMFPRLKSAPGSSPMLVFNGDDFEASETTRALRSLLLDLFRAPDETKPLDISGVDRVIVLTLRGDSKILFRQYNVSLKRSEDSPLPTTALSEAGPHFDLDLRRSQLAPETLMRSAMKKPRDPTVVRKRKNISRDDIGDKIGRIHVGRQDLGGLALARMKGLGKKRNNAIDVEGGDNSTEETTGNIGDTADDNLPETNAEETTLDETPKKKVRFE